MIYTKTGDKGTTALASGERVSKTDLRIETYGTADELNSFVGLLRSKFATWPDEDAKLAWVQNRLFNLGAELSDAPGVWMTKEDGCQLEQWMDEMQKELPPLRAFILPGGSESVSLCHVCRTITRRLERRMVEIEAKVDGRVFVNRLSDFFFVLSRKVAGMEKIEQFEWKK